LNKSGRIAFKLNSLIIDSIFLFNIKLTRTKSAAVAFMSIIDNIFLHDIISIIHRAINPGYPVQRQCYNVTIT